jgi:Undecaprenyl-phosphate glucose phosphotransferase
MGFIGPERAAGELEVPLRLPASAYGSLSTDAVSLPALLIDGLVIWLLGAVTGTAYQIVAFHSYGSPEIYAGTGLLVAVLFCGMTRVTGTAGPARISADFGRARLAVIAWFSTFLFLTVIAFSLKIGTTFSRGAVFSFFAFGLPVVVATRVIVPRILARSRHASRGSEVIIAAPQFSSQLPHFSLELRSHGCAGVHTVEFDGAVDNVGWPVERQRILRRLLDTARAAGPGEIYIFSEGIAPERVASIVTGLRLVPRAVYVVPPEYIAGMFDRTVRRFGSAVAVEMQKVPLPAVARYVKRAIDVMVAGAALLFTLPAFAVIALAVKLDSPGPVFFLQQRNGYRGRPFRIMKFRTMTVLEDGDVVTPAKRGDHRVTRVGRWLRRTSLDELPQLINILRGEMSLVGPRPHAVAHDQQYARLIENYELRQHVKPGVTGWAQVNGLRGETPTVDLMFRRIEYDLWYAANCSVTLDIQILVRTLFVVLRQDNAY